jgi:hypothetical protein
MSGMDTPETLLQAIQYFSDEQLCLNYGSRHEKLNVANRPTTMQLGNRSIRAVLHYVPCG